MSVGVWHILGRHKENPSDLYDYWSTGHSYADLMKAGDELQSWASDVPWCEFVLRWEKASE
jgi:hypothetical protein